MNQKQAVAGIAATAEVLQAVDSRVGGASLIQSVVRYLNSEVGPLILAPDSSTEVATLFSAAASISDMAGWMSHDAGLDRQARHYFDRAYRLAVGAQNAPLMAAICASMAHLAVETHNPSDAIRIANVGLDHVRASDGVERLMARLFAMQARGYAQQGEANPAFNSLERAGRVLDRAGATQPWTPPFDEGSLRAESALCFLQVAELAEAERHITRVLELRGNGQVRSRALAHLTLARVKVAARQPDHAASLCIGVVEATATLSSVRVTNKLDHLSNLLAGHGSVPAVANFLEQLSTSNSNMESSQNMENKWPV